MLSGGVENLKGGEVPAFDAEDRAGPGEGGVPGNPEVDAFETVRGARFISHNG
jgi:hypothetical protein